MRCVRWQYLSNCPILEEHLLPLQNSYSSQSGKFLNLIWGATFAVLEAGMYETFSFCRRFHIRHVILSRREHVNCNDSMFIMVSGIRFCSYCFVLPKFENSICPSWFHINIPLFGLTLGEFWIFMEMRPRFRWDNGSRISHHLTLIFLFYFFSNWVKAFAKLSWILNKFVLRRTKFQTRTAGSFLFSSASLGIDWLFNC